MQILLLLPIVAVWWLYSEARLSTNHRMISGLCCIGLAAFAGYNLGMVIPRYERTFHKSSLLLAGELLAKGETKRVEQAIRSYNVAATNKSTYAASMEMWSVLNHGPDKK